MAELGERKERILRAVVIEYVTAAEPVPSELISAKYELGVRGATIRSELAEMADLGYLAKPHTSSGRIPSDQGYRYFVDRLIIHTPVRSEDDRQIRGATQEEETLHEVLAETTKVLSRLTHLISAAATQRNSAVAVRSAILTAIGPERALLVLILQNGHVENRFLDLPVVGVTLEQLGMINAALIEEVQGKTLGALKRWKAPAVADPAVAAILGKVAVQLRQIARQLTRGKLIREGEEYLLSQPEFVRDVAALEQILAGIEDEDRLYSVIVSPAGAHGTTIGSEHSTEELHRVAILRHTIFVGEQEAGTLALIGPTRQDYQTNLSLLSHAAQAIGETLAKIVR